MKKRYVFYSIAFVFIFVLWIFLELRYGNSKAPEKESKNVYLKKTETGYQLVRNGLPFYINGASGNSHFQELSAIGGNTVRVYDTINLLSILNEAQKNNLAVIVDIPIPGYSKDKMFNYYLDKEYVHKLKLKIRALVHKFKNHPALLIWNLGNEVNYPLVFRKNTFIETFNDLIDIIHQEDPNHPVGTTLPGAPLKTLASIYFHSPDLDLVSFNTFGDTKGVKSKVDQISFLFRKKPYYYGEMGSDGPWEASLNAWGAPIERTTEHKAEQIRNRYKIIANNKDDACLGALIFYWGNKLEITHTWFSLFHGDHKSEIISEIESIWGNKAAKPSQIGLSDMLIDGKGGNDNIVFATNELKIAELKFNENKNDSLTIDWEIHPEEYYLFWYERTYQRKLYSKNLGNFFVSFDNKSATFRTPDKEGPYRIFAYIYDQDGYFATTNIPFYILKAQ